MKGYRRNTRLADFVFVTDFDLCWPYTGPQDWDGYGMFHGKRAARVAYKIAYGEIQEGMIVHHICQNKLCVNPRHLVAVRHRSHPDDGAAVNRNKTHCVNGHELVGNNVRQIVRVRDGRVYRERQCIKCCSENKRKRKLRQGERIIKCLLQHKAQSV